jgi:cytochrome c-type biogenesis protein CcmH
MVVVMRSSGRRRAAVAVAAAFVLAACAPTAPRQGQAGDAHAIETRLLAPCCWIQTLDMHESELATALRAEITSRVAHGETATMIEDDLVARYGERIRAAPEGADTRSTIPALVGLFMAVALVGLVVLLRRWKRRGEMVADRAPALLTSPATTDDYDTRLDEELARLDDR